MYKIAHISDSHISFADQDSHGKKLIELLSDIKERNCDHIVLTGDVADNPNRKDLLYVREILSHFGLLDSALLTLIPGNHDIFGGAPKGPDFFRFVMICSEINYDEKADMFIEIFKETFPNNHSFPFLKIINNIALIGINSVDRFSEEKNPEGSNGKVSKEDFKKIKELLSSDSVKDKFKIILIHHHFNPPKFKENLPAHSMWLRSINRKMRIYGKKALMKMFKKYKVNLILHGHTHVNDIYHMSDLTFLNSSASIAPITDDNERKYNIISIPGENDTEKNITVESITI